MHPFAKRFFPLFAISALTSAGPLSANEADPDHSERPHHLSILVAGTHIEAEDETAITLGVDYEYRVSEWLGLGFVAERAFGGIDSTSILAVADIHIWEGLAVQVGPGVEFVDEEERLIGRFGGLYEFELGKGFTLSPQLHYDLSEDQDAIVFGIAVGRAF
ncbi:MAG: hypothetical protein AAGA34_00705 [Pseudomonadota bacterium]